jgi:outer membrane protein assembly factor BamB
MTTKSLPTLAVLAALAAPAFATDWPQWRGPDRTDVSNEKGLLREWPKGGPKLLWTFRDAGTGLSGFAVVGDRLYSMGADDNKEYVFAVDLKSQKKVWSTEVGPRTVNGWADGPRGTPTVADGFVYALGGQGHLICVKADTGAQVWLKDFKGDLKGAQQGGWGYTESPLVDGDQMIASPGGSEGCLAAFDKKTGDVFWRSKGFTDNAAYSSVLVADIAGVHQYIRMTDKSVAGIAAKDGTLLWRISRSGPTAAIPTPVYADGNVFVTSGYSAGCNLIKVTKDGESFKADQVYANKDMTNHHGGVLRIGDYVYGYSDGKGWVCMEFKTGKVMWSDKSLGKGSVTAADGHLYCYAENDGTVALVDANPTSWKEKGRLKIPEETKLSRKRAKIWTHPVVANGKLYLRDQDLIFCYDLSDGKSA